MSILLEFIPNLFVALAFDFVLYLTGAIVLRVISFGLLKYQLHSYSEYKALKGNTDNPFLTPYLIGIVFYALIIASLAFYN